MREACEAAVSPSKGMGTRTSMTLCRSAGRPLPSGVASGAPRTVASAVSVSQSMLNSYPEPASSLALVAALLAIVALASCAPAIDLQPHNDRYVACGRRTRSLRVHSGEVAVVGSIHQIDDATPVDGPVRILLIDTEGAPRKLFFPSLFTVPGPSEHRRSVYRAIAPSQPGDCVRLSGIPDQDGSVVIQRFENLDRAHTVRP
jgi:hypothetical protein